MKNSRKRRNGALVLMAAIIAVSWIGFGNVGAASATKPGSDGEHKTILCHHDNGARQYKLIDVDFASVKPLRGHDHHADDIIPVIHTENFDYPGKNLSGGGQEILDNGCVVPTVETTSPPTEITVPPTVIPPTIIVCDATTQGHIDGCEPPPGEEPPADAPPADAIPGTVHTTG